MSPSIQHDSTARCFSKCVDGADCLLEYELADSVMTITHTEVPAALGGRGIAGELVQSALDTARTKGWRVVPVCSYAAAWIKRHPAYADLQA
ncbi:MAG: GNAT family N-acetyltransferase [Rhodanobacter sp.]